MATVGIPVKLLHEAEKHIVTIELKNGEVYRGLLVDAEDSMNCHLSNVTVTLRDGRTASLEYAFVRGSKIRWVIVPDMLKNAPMFRNDGRPKGLGRGVAAAVGRGTGSGTGTAPPAPGRRPPTGR
jgi:small nuclear ribonucleoprotein D3